MNLHYISFITLKRQPVHMQIQTQKYNKHTKLNNIQKLLKQYKKYFFKLQKHIWNKHRIQQIRT